MADSKVVNPSGVNINIPDSIKQNLTQEELQVLQGGLDQIQTQSPPPAPSAETAEFKQLTYPTVMVELPSKGLFYPDGHPLRKGVIEMKYMTAKEEDILTTESYIKTGVILDKLFQSLIVTNVRYDDILVADKDALMIAARAYGYGEIYDAVITTPSGKEQKVKVDLLKDLNPKPFNEELITPGQNKITFHAPTTGDEIVFRLPTIGVQKEIDAYVTKHKRINQPEENWTARLIHMIVSVNGNTNRPFIEQYVPNMLARDTRVFKTLVKSIQPGIDMSVELIDEETQQPFRGDIAFGLDFFWPDLRL